MTDEVLKSTIMRVVDDDRFNKYVDHYLEIAKQAIIARRYPYNEKARWTDIPEAYHPYAVEIAVYLINRRGAEGETSHSESGVSRTYESSGIPESYLRMIVPYVGVPR